MSIEPTTLREIGRIVAAHGVMGEMKVAPETDDPERFTELQTIYVGDDEKSASIFEIRSVRMQTTKHGITVILALDGISDRDSAQAQRQKRIFARETDLPALSPGEYFLSDLIGMAVQSDSNGYLGRVMDVFELPGQNVLSVKLANGRDTMIPAIPEFLKDIDFEQQTVTVTVIEGLF